MLKCHPEYRDLHGYVHDYQITAGGALAVDLSGDAPRAVVWRVAEVRIAHGHIDIYVTD